MKNLHKLALIAAVSLASSGAVAGFTTNPSCKNNSGDHKFSIAVINTGLRMHCGDRDKPGKYCFHEGMGGRFFKEDPKVLTTCMDPQTYLYDGWSESYSFAKAPTSDVVIYHGVEYSGNKRTNVPKEFYLKYSNGHIETNCSEVVQPDGKCQLSQTHDNNVVLTISSAE